MQLDTTELLATRVHRTELTFRFPTTMLQLNHLLNMHRSLKFHMQKSCTAFET